MNIICIILQQNVVTFQLTFQLLTCIDQCRIHCPSEGIIANSLLKGHNIRAVRLSFSLWSFYVGLSVKVLPCEILKHECLLPPKINNIKMVLLLKKILWRFPLTSMACIFTLAHPWQLDPVMLFVLIDVLVHVYTWTDAERYLISMYNFFNENYDL